MYTIHTTPYGSKVRNIRADRAPRSAGECQPEINRDQDGNEHHRLFGEHRGRKQEHGSRQPALRPRSRATSKTRSARRRKTPRPVHPRNCCRSTQRSPPWKDAARTTRPSASPAGRRQTSGVRRRRRAPPPSRAAESRLRCSHPGAPPVTRYTSRSPGLRHRTVINRVGSSVKAENVVSEKFRHVAQ